MATAMQPIYTGAAHAAPQPSSLRQLTADVERIAAMVEALDEGEDVNEQDRERLVRDLVHALSGTREKIDRTNAVLTAYENAATAAAKEAKRLKEREAWFTRQRDRLEAYVIWTIKNAGVKRMEGEISSFEIRLNPVTVQVDDVSAVPKPFLRIPPPSAGVPDKGAIKDALQSGVDVPGCRLTRSERLVRI